MLDDQFVRRATEIVERYLDDPEFTAERFAGEMAVSRMQLHRKLKALTGLTTREFIRTYRLGRAAQLLAGGYGNVTEVSMAVGFKSPPHFTDAFRKQFGKPPSQYAAESDAQI